MERIPAPAEGAAVERAPSLRPESRRVGSPGSLPPSPSDTVSPRWRRCSCADIDIDMGPSVVRMSNVNQLLLRGGLRLF